MSSKAWDGLKQYMLQDPNVGFAISLADTLKGIGMLGHGNRPQGMGLSPGPQGNSEFPLYVRWRVSSGALDTWVTNPDYQVANVKLTCRSHEGALLNEVIGRVNRYLKDNPKAMEHGVIKPAGGIGGILAAANAVIKVMHERSSFWFSTHIRPLFGYLPVIPGRHYLCHILILANFLAFTYMVWKDTA